MVNPFHDKPHVVSSTLIIYGDHAKLTKMFGVHRRYIYMWARAIEIIIIIIKMGKHDTNLMWWGLWRWGMELLYR